MREIPAALSAAQCSLQARPCPACQAEARRFGLAAPAWRLLYLGSESAQPHGAAACADGSIVRARCTGSGILQRARVVDPENPAGWSGWGGSYAAASLAPAVAADPQSLDVFIVYVGASGYGLRCLQSSDAGSTWSASTLAYSEPSTSRITGVAAALRASGPRELLVFYTLDAGGAGADDVVRVLLRRTDGTWGTPASWSLGARYAFCGLDAGWDGDFRLILAGREPAAPYPYRLCTASYGDGGDYPAGVWGGLAVVEASDHPDYRWQSPALCLADTARYAVVEEWAGGGGYTRTLLGAHRPSAGFAAPLWSDGQPFDFAPPAGAGARLRAAPDGGRLYLIGHDRAWAADLDEPACDLSARLLSYRYREAAAGGGLMVVLDNASGALNDAGMDGSPYSALRVGGSLRLARGLHIGGADWLAGLTALPIEELAWEQEDGTARLCVRAGDVWENLQRWRAGRLFAWPAGGSSLAGMGALLAARAGLDFDCRIGEGSAAMAGLQPALAVEPGADGAAALSRLVTLAPDVLRFDGEAGLLYRELRADDAPAYAVGGAGEHPLLESRVVMALPADNLVEVYGAGEAFGWAADYPGIERAGLRRRQISSSAYILAYEAAGRALGELTRRAGAGPAGTLRLRPIHGLELWDVLWVTLPVGPAGGRRFRVVGIEEHYERRRGLYEQRLRVLGL